MAGLTAFRRIQIGKESTRGTPIAATKILLGKLEYTPTLDFYNPIDEERNSLAAHHRLSIVGQRADLKFDAAANYEQLIYFLAMALKGGITASTPGGGVNSRDWTFNPSLTAVNAQNAYTFEYGDDQQEYESAFVMAKSLEFVYAMNAPVMLRADMFGYFPAKSTFTGALTVPTINDIISMKTKIYIDTTWAGLGTTQKTGALVSGNVKFNTGLQMTKYGDGALDFSSFAEDKNFAEIELVMVHNAIGEALYDDYAAQTLKFVRLITTGAIIEAALTYTLTVDLAIRITEPPKMFDTQDGEDVISFKGRTFNDPISGVQLQVVVRNIETTLG